MTTTTETSRYRVGQRVQNRGSLRWAVVLEVVPGAGARGGSEYRVQPEKPLFEGDSNEPTWWGDFHIGRSEEPRAEVQSTTLTRAQWRLLLELRQYDMVFATGRRRETIDALTNAKLAFETTSGQLRISEEGRRAKLCVYRTVVHSSVDARTQERVG